MRKEFDSKDEVRVFSDTTHRVGYVLPNISRIWDIGTFKDIPIKELQEAANTKGGRTLLEEQSLLVKDSEAREYLGLPALNKYNPEMKDLEETLKNGSMEQLEDILQYCLDSTLDKIVHLAVNLPIENMSKAELISSYSGKNILSAIEAVKEDKKVESESESPKVSEEGQPIKRRRKAKE